MHAFDGRTDRQTATFLVTSPRWHSMQRENKQRLLHLRWGKGDESAGHHVDLPRLACIG